MFNNVVCVLLTNKINCLLQVFGLWFVDGDAVSGICYVGNQNTNNAYYFVVVPLLLYLGIGSTFSIFGFFDLCRIRTSIKKVPTQLSDWGLIFFRRGTRPLKKDNMNSYFSIFLLEVVFQTLLLFHITKGFVYVPNSCNYFCLTLVLTLR